MQFSKLAFFAALAAPLVAAQDLGALQGLPSCALSPAISALASTGCGTDISCACKNTAFVSGLLKTVSSVCSPADLATATSLATQLCASHGVTIAVDSAPTSSGANVPHTTGSPTGSSTNGSAPHNTTSSFSNAATGVSGSPAMAAGAVGLAALIMGL